MFFVVRWVKFNLVLMTMTLKFEIVMRLFKMLIIFMFVTKCRGKRVRGRDRKKTVPSLNDMSVCNPAPAPELIDRLFTNLTWGRFTNYC